MSDEEIIDLSGENPFRDTGDEEDIIIITETSKKRRIRPQPQRKVQIIDLTTDSPSTDVSGSSTSKKLIKTEPDIPKHTPPKRQTPSPKKAAIECTICMDAAKEPSSTACGHLFCDGCIRNWVKKTPKCPICRKKITARQIHRIYIQ